MAFGALSMLAGGAASAQSVCVECREPEKSYRCTIKGSEKVQNVKGSSRAIEFVCISEIARARGHQSCRVSTGYAGPCIGEHHEVDIARPAGDSAAAASPEKSAGESSAKSEQQAQPKPKGPPQTLEELARDTMSKSKEQMTAADEGMRKAGSAVTGTLKKTWDCMASLFSRC